MHPLDFFVRRDGALRAPVRVALFLAATAVGAILIPGLLVPVLSAVGIVAWARRLGVPLDQWEAVLVFALATWIALRAEATTPHKPEPAGAGVPESGHARQQRVAVPRPDWSRVDLHTGALASRALGVGLLAGTFGILVPCVILLLARRLRFEPATGTASWAKAASIAALTLVPAALAEELAVRGYVLTVLRDVWKPQAAVLVTSALFAALHLLNPAPTPLTTLSVGLAGVLLASVRLATQSLYAAAAAHFAWNFVQAAILHTPVSGIVLSETGYRTADAGPAWLTGGAWGPEGGAAAVAAMLVATFLLVRWWRAHSGRRALGARDANGNVI